MGGVQDICVSLSTLSLSLFSCFFFSFTMCNMGQNTGAETSQKSDFALFKKGERGKKSAQESCGSYSKGGEKRTLPRIKRLTYVVVCVLTLYGCMYMRCKNGDSLLFVGSSHHSVLLLH